MRTLSVAATSGLEADQSMLALTDASDDFPNSSRAR
jgi:hypothetical protein